MKSISLRNPAAPITPEQIKAIKMGQRALGIDDEAYRDTLWGRYQVTSCRDLNQEQASDLIEDYISRGFVLIQPAYKAKTRGAAKAQKHPRPTSAANHGMNTTRPMIPRGSNVVALVKPDEIDKINAVAALVEWRVENGLALFLEKRMGIKGGKVRTSAEAYKAIEGLKKMFENQMKAKHGPAWWTMDFGRRDIHEYIYLHRPAEWR